MDAVFISMGFSGIFCLLKNRFYILLFCIERLVSFLLSFNYNSVCACKVPEAIVKVHEFMIFNSRNETAIINKIE